MEFRISKIIRWNKFIVFLGMLAFFVPNFVFACFSDYTISFLDEAFGFVILLSILFIILAGVFKIFKDEKWFLISCRLSFILLLIYLSGLIWIHNFFGASIIKNVLAIILNAALLIIPLILSNKAKQKKRSLFIFWRIVFIVFVVISTFFISIVSFFSLC